MGRPFVNGAVRLLVLASMCLLVVVDGTTAAAAAFQPSWGSSSVTTRRSSSAPPPSCRQETAVSSVSKTRFNVHSDDNDKDGNNDNDNDDQDPPTPSEDPPTIPTTFPLAIFPLRKAVKFPTDLVTLNLYEPRYLALAEHVLESRDPPLFGALYAADKVQMIRKGTEPMVPICKPGDVGVVCVVEDSSDDMVPTRDMQDERRRIRLSGLAFARFRIHSIIESGSGMVDGSPFVRAEVSWLFDDESCRDDTAAAAAAAPEKPDMDRTDSTTDDDDDDDDDNDDDDLMLEIYLQAHKNKYARDLILDCMRWVRALGPEASCIDNLRALDELYTFFEAGRLADLKASSMDDMAVLKSTSQLQRMKFLVQKEEQINGNPLERTLKRFFA